MTIMPAFEVVETTHETAVTFLKWAGAKGRPSCTDASIRWEDRAQRGLVLEFSNCLHPGDFKAIEAAVVNVPHGKAYHDNHTALRIGFNGDENIEKGLAALSSVPAFGGAMQGAIRAALRLL